MSRFLKVLLHFLILVTLSVSGCWGEQFRAYELRGVLQSNGGMSFAGSNVVVQLSSPLGPAAFTALADSKGSFRIKKVPPGMYLLTAFIPRVARTKRTIEVGPSFSDGKGKISITLKLDPRPPRRGGYLVSAVQLAVPEKARTEYEKGLQRAAARDISGATACFRKAVDLAPQFSAAWYQLGLIGRQQGKFLEAANDFRAALNYLPDNYQALINLGGVLLAQGSAKEAIAINERAVKLRPDDAQAQAQLGFSYLLQGQLDEAERHLRITVSLDPANYYYPQILLADIYQRRNDWAAMARELEEFMSLHPDSQKAREVAPILEKLRSETKNADQNSP